MHAHPAVSFREKKACCGKRHILGKIHQPGQQKKLPINLKTVQ